MRAVRCFQSCPSPSQLSLVRCGPYHPLKSIEGARSLGTGLVFTGATALLARFPACNALYLSFDLMLGTRILRPASCMRHLSFHPACNGTLTARQSASQPWFRLMREVI